MDPEWKDMPYLGGVLKTLPEFFVGPKSGRKFRVLRYDGIDTFGPPGPLEQLVSVSVLRCWISSSSAKRAHTLAEFYLN